MKLDERLSLCAAFVREGARVADIGTDHAYLPVWLVQSGKVLSAIAADVREGPLENAVSNIRKNGLENRIRAVLSDGLEQIKAEETDDIIIAGMGGELIARIIEAAGWVRNPDKHLILQPMTRAEELRQYLCENGFATLREEACISGRKSYSVMLCAYDGKTRPCSIQYAYVGNLWQQNSPQARQYMYAVCVKLKKKLRGYEPGTKEAAELSELISRLEHHTEGYRYDQCEGAL